MAQTQPPNECSLPRWLVVAISVVVVGHLGAIVMLVLSAPSGQWPSAFGPIMAPPPPFAQQINNEVLPRYLRPLKLTHNYHFSENQPAFPGVFFEVRLFDADGSEIKQVKIPEDNACMWTRHRQELLARALADDRPAEARSGVKIPAVGQKDPTVTYWAPSASGPGGQTLELKTIKAFDLPTEPVMRPSDWSQTLASSYVRYLCRKYNAASGELIRHTREPVQMDASARPTDLIAIFKETSK